MTEAGAVLSRREGRLQVTLEGQRLADVGTANLEGVVLWGANATVPALRLLLAREIPLVMLDGEGRYRGMLVPAWSGHVLLRDRQRALSAHRRLAFARALVRGKILNQATVLERWGRRGVGGLSSTVRELRRLAQGIERADGLGALRGIEGTAAREYYRAVGEALPGGFQRSRRPPRDAVNAALSVGYGCLRERCLSAATMVGFDPFVGVYHGRKYGRPALALDLMEPLRPAIDRVVFGMARRRELHPHHVRPTPGGCLLSPEGYELVLGRIGAAFARLVEHGGVRIPLGRVPMEQARSLARATMADVEPEVFRLPRD